MKVGWISGWAVPARFVEECAERRFPNARHYALSPTRENARALARGDGCDIACGYSLGALLLCEAASLCKARVPIVCWAGFLGFCAESGKDGATPRAHLRALKRRLRMDRAAALASFYALTGFSMPFGADEIPSDEMLAEGLGLLDSIVLERAPENVLCVRGGRDVFINAMRADTLWPRTRLLPQATHAIDNLFSLLSDEDRAVLPFF